MRNRSNSLVVLACTALVASSAIVEAALAGGKIEPLTTVRVGSGFSRPVFVTYAPNDFARLFIVEQVGRIRILNIVTGHPLGTPFLDINSIVGGGSDERGLLGLAFHPNYQSNGYFYVNYTNNSNDTTIRRYTVSSNPNVANAGTGLTLLTIDQPFINHNGGWIGFDPTSSNAYLYIGMGDGGSGNDPGNRAQDITNQKLGKILRIDVDGNNGQGGNYGNPPSNPFVGITGDDEIWAYGIRNPWRASFDRDNGDLYIGDVGQNAREEIDIQSGNSAGGENYGWRCMEGNGCTGLSGCTCNSPQLKDPAWDYLQSGNGCSVIGGYVYRGCDIPTLNGTYFYADYCTSRIWSFLWNGHGVENQTSRTTELDPPGALAISSISSFGEDARGEIYICDLFGGEIFKIVPVTPTVDSTGDLDANCVVNVADLLILFSNWGPCDDCSFCDADINHDCTVNTADLLAMFANWG